MRKFMLKMSFLLVPVAAMLVYYMSYEKSGGDLNRLGKISVEKNYRDIFKSDFKTEKKYMEISDVDLKTTGRIDILVVGDSFSRQKNYGYQNYLACMSGREVVNIDNLGYNAITDDPVRMLCFLAAGDLFDKIKIRYVILQNVERAIVKRGGDIDAKTNVSLNELNDLYYNRQKIKEKTDSAPGLGIFQDAADYFLFSILYKFNDRAYFSQVYKEELTEKIFSIKKNELLFYYEDVKNIKYSTKEAVDALNEKLNVLSEKLRSKGVKLIVLPSPDKYDLYCGYIKNNILPVNHFFENMKNKNKGYIYLDTKDILIAHIKEGEKDIYFADDTHWSPAAAKIIAGEIYKRLK